MQRLLEDRFALGAPFNGLKAFFTTPQLDWIDKLRNALALGTSPIVRGLIDCPDELALGIDTDWREHYRPRTQHPPHDAEKAITSDGKVQKVFVVPTRGSARKPAIRSLSKTRR